MDAFRLVCDIETNRTEGTILSRQSTCDIKTAHKHIFQIDTTHIYSLNMMWQSRVGYRHVA